MADFTDVKSRANLREYARQNLEQVKGGLVCPLCSSGKGEKKTPAFSIKGDYWKCFSCGAGGDIFDLAGAINNVTGKSEQLALVCEWMGEDSQAQNTTAEMPPPRGSSPYIAQCARNIGIPEVQAYLEGRGITLKQARSMGLGYDPAAKRVVIPWKGSQTYWIARDITDTSSRKYIKPKASEVGPQPLWNPQALRSTAFFVVEGPFDALALEMMGYEAVALGGTGVGCLVAEMSRQMSSACAILLMDGDEAGQKAQARIKAVLEEAAMACIDFPGERFAKDPDEMRRSDETRLRELLDQAVQAASEYLSDRSQRRSSQVYRNLRAANVAEIAEGMLEAPRERGYVPSGIRGLDEMLDGGLRPGLTVLAAASSLGKTTLCVQMADRIAAEGRSVLFVTLEQSARDLVMKSLSRGLFELSAGEECVSSHEMTDPGKRAQWAEQTAGRFKEAVKHYQNVVAPRLEVLEGIGRTSVADVAAHARQMAEEGEAPVVFIDYLQLLANEGILDERLSVNRSVTDLRRLARDLNVPVVCVSAVRRESYLAPVTLDSMKESGAIEYGADVVLGLQAAGVDVGEAPGSDRRARRLADRKARSGKAAEYREVELVVLKQREGRVHGADQAVPLTFVPQAATFV